MISVIIRTRNEERWISACLDSVYGQEGVEFEVVLVDNESEDSTVAKARNYPVSLVSVAEFRPGQAINEGVRSCAGELIVCLSGHCIPTNAHWLKTLVAKLDDPKVAGVYGRQQPMSFSSDRDKRDLLTVFGLDPRTQKKDPFFHNANSAFRRDTWNRFPFDEQTQHIEDRIWGQQVLAAGYELVYEPAASVYHFHGIHQDDDPGRRRSVVQIMENLGKDWDRPARDTQSPRPPSPGQLNAIALIPVRGDPVFVGDVPLLWYTLEAVRGSEFLRSAVVLTDSEATAELAREIGAEVPFLRPPELSGSLVTVSDVLKFGLQELEHWNIYPDICLVLEETYPFRPVGLADVLISALIREGTDCALAVKAESRSIWVHKGNELSTVSPLIPRSLKSEEFLISLFGLGFATRPANIRDGSLGLEHPFAYRVGEPLAAIELRTKEERDNAVALLSQFWKQHYST